MCKVRDSEKNVIEKEETLQSSSTTSPPSTATETKNFTTRQRPSVRLSVGMMLSILLSTSCIGFYGGRNYSKIVMYFDLWDQLDERINQQQQQQQETMNEESIPSISLNQTKTRNESLEEEIDGTLAQLIKQTKPRRTAMWNNDNTHQEHQHRLQQSRDIVRREMMIHPAMTAQTNPTLIAVSSWNPQPWLEEIMKHKSVGSLLIKDTCPCKDINTSNEEYSRFGVDEFDFEYIRLASLVETRYFTKGIDVVFVDELSLDEKEESIESLKVWYQHMSSDGILVTPLSSSSSYERHLQLSQLEAAGFDSITDYDVDGRHRYAVGFRSRRTNSAWHQSEALMTLDVRKQFENSGLVEYFDGASMLSIQYPTRISENEYCHYKNALTLEGSSAATIGNSSSMNDNDHACRMATPDPCKRGHGLDPKTPNLPAQNMTVRKSLVAEQAGRGVFALAYVPKDAYIGLDVSSHPVRLPAYATEVMESLIFSKRNRIYQEFANNVHVYFEAYGFLDEAHGEPEYVVDSGLLTFVNHGCNGTNNVGLVSNVTEFTVDLEGPIPVEFTSACAAAAKGSEDIYDPAEARVFHMDAWVAKTSKEMYAGDEFLDNYLTFGGEDEFRLNVRELRSECSGANIGLVERQQNKLKRLDDTKLEGSEDDDDEEED